MPKLGKIIDIVEYHVCPDEPVEFDLTPIDLPIFNEDVENNKFIKSLNDLQPPSILGSLRSDDLRDRRPKEQIKTSAPPSLKDLFKSLEPSISKNISVEGSESDE